MALVWQNNVPSTNFPRAHPLRDGMKSSKSTAGTQSANEHHHKRTLCIFDGATSLGNQKGSRRCAHLGGGYGRNTEEPARAPLSAVCTVCTQDSKKSTGNLLVILRMPGDVGRQT